MKFKYVFIGAGTANLSAANRLLSLGESDILIVDKGNRLQKRHCPGLSKNTCLFCKSGCYVTEGIGGSDALFGNKMCYFPSSSHVLKYFSKENFSDSVSFLNEFLYPYFNFDPLHYSNSNSISTKKKYHSEILTDIDFARMIALLTSQLFLKNIIKEGTDVVSIKKSDKYFFVKTSENESYQTENLIVGTGRSSHNFLRELFHTLGIPFIENNQDIGIRIETAGDNFSNEYYYQQDPKFKFSYGALGSGRTFCAVNGGRIVPVQFGKSFYADGIFSNDSSEINNIALMVRTHTPLAKDEIEKWCAKINSHYDKKLLIGDINLNQLRDHNLVDNILPLIPFWPNKTYKDLMKNLLEDLIINKYKIFKDEKQFVNPSLKIYGPAIDNYLPRPKINDGLSTDVDNLFIIGDAAGRTRGYVQAMFSGVAWANNIMNKNSNVSVNIKNEWSISV